MHTRKLNSLTAVLMFAALSGCGVLGPTDYKEPLQGDTATLVLNKSGHMLVIPNIYAGAAECTDRERLAPIPDDGEIVRKIAASQPISFSLTRTRNYLTDACIVTATFTPAAGHRYIAQVKGHGDTCYLDLSDAGKPGDEYVPPKSVPKTDRQWRRPLSEHGPFCSE